MRPEFSLTTPPITLIKAIRAAPFKSPKAPDRQIVTYAYDPLEGSITVGLLPDSDK